MVTDDEAATARARDAILKWYPRVPPAVADFVHDLVDARSGLHPSSQALCSWDGSLTYRELSDVSSRLARQLQAEGIGPEDVVPLFFEKSLWAVVGMLAVMKAGGAFLALDVSQPVGRNQGILEQIGARFALASTRGLEVCGGLVKRTLVVDARAVEDLGRLELSGSPKPVLNTSNAAYMIFTSGSTGVPKGVVIEHSQLATTCVYAGERMGCDGQRRALQFASYAFDAFISDIFPTLLYGGTVCIPSDWERDNDLIGAVCRMGVNSVKITPSLANILELEKVPTLRTLILGGESVPSSMIEKWAKRVNLILVYGPTECCVICYMKDCSSLEVAPGEIGRPVGSRGWIVKQGNCGQLADVGEVGELVIEGPVVGRGYLGDAEKTAAQFIERPAWMPACDDLHSHRRLYRTGDLARYMSNGAVCYAGRIDNQVKIRGQRLELEEVEKKLTMQIHYVTGYPEYERDIAGPWHWQSQQVYKLPPSLDLERFRTAWDTAVRRHQSLRTRLILSATGIFQVVLDAESWLPKWQDAERLEDYLEKDKSRIMGFGDELVRLAVVQTPGSGERYFVMTMQHIIYDAFSLAMLFDELERDYFRDGTVSRARPAMNQFIQHITGADKTAALEFWTTHLAVAATKSLLTFPPGVKLFDLNITEISVITKMPERRGTEATMPTIMEVAAAIAIAGRLQCADVILYSDRSGRNLPVEGIQDLIGPTTTFLPVRIHIEQSQLVSDLLRASQEFQNKKLPFEHLGWLELREMHELKPVLRHSVNMNINVQPLNLLGQRLGLEFVRSWSMCDDPFGINVDIFGDGIKWAVYHDARFINAETAGGLLRDFVMLDVE
ncbi:Nonribosomal peptide synthetase 1 [Coniochaeta hoffmannii]|uniref:Nonribosomal peptide synthetase 1 n=1 Tax=Coniochaeta hoffmannii TaxID=91930 RepID=A0AA38RWN6_9PEZI|nr:Nonribosomal peptide synthetase 1 [Coniochaeta hoffmannii]